MNGIPDEVPAPLARLMAAMLEATAARPQAGAAIRAAAADAAGAEPDSADASGHATDDAVARAGLDALRRALSKGDARAAAFHLLAADALITQACANAVSEGLPSDLAPERFAALLEDR